MKKTRTFVLALGLAFSIFTLSYTGRASAVS
jgi:hypothetical protein